MNKLAPRKQAASRRKRLILFVVGAALGSALGIIVGALLTLWLGDTTVQVFQRVSRRRGNDDEHPNFDLLLQ